LPEAVEDKDDSQTSLFENGEKNNNSSDSDDYEDKKDGE
jgi:hypothetical protein